MAARGTNAKQVISEKIKQAFGADYVGMADGKIYVYADDGGEKVQIAISMTCPKVPFNPANEEMDFSVMANAAAPATQSYQPAQMDEKELDNVRAMIAEFGL